MFNRKSPIHLAALAAEITADPEGLGYGAEIKTSAQADLMNAQGRSPQRLPVAELDLLSVSAHIDRAEFETLSPLHQNWLLGMLNRPEALTNSESVDKFEKLFGPTSVDADGNPTEFPAGITGATILAVSALRDYMGSRAEELFGQGTKIGRRDIVEALAHASRQAQGAG